MQTLTATILGLNSEASQALKLSIEATLPSEFIFEWANISEKPVDVIFLNQVFLHSNTIQSYLNRQTKTQYLCLAYNAALSGTIIDNQLHYPFETSQDLTAWLQLKFGQTAPVQPCSIRTDLNKNIEEMLLARNSFLRLYQHSQDLAIIDTRTERVFIHPEMSPEHFFAPDLQQSYAKSSRVNAVQGYFKIADLKVWLWDMLYPARHTFAIQGIAPEYCYQLRHWPQLPSSPERKHLLKIAALFAQGAEIEYVIQKVECSAQQVKTFIYLTQLLQMSQQISQQEARFLTQRTQQESTSTGVFQGLFGKLRRKLGI